MKVLGSNKSVSLSCTGAKYADAFILSTRSFSSPCSLTCAPASCDSTRICS